MRLKEIHNIKHNNRGLVQMMFLFNWVIFRFLRCTVYYQTYPKHARHLAPTSRKTLQVHKFHILQVSHQDFHSSHKSFECIDLTMILPMEHLLKGSCALMIWIIHGWVTHGCHNYWRTDSQNIPVSRYKGIATLDKGLQPLNMNIYTYKYIYIHIYIVYSIYIYNIYA